MTTYHIIDFHNDRRETVSAETDAGALELVYNTLRGWNHDGRDMSAEIAAGVVTTMGYKAPEPLYRDEDPVGFWHQCIALVVSDNQDFAQDLAELMVKDDAA